MSTEVTVDTLGGGELGEFRMALEIYIGSELERIVGAPFKAENVHIVLERGRGSALYQLTPPKLKRFKVKVEGKPSEVGEKWASQFKCGEAHLTKVVCEGSHLQFYADEAAFKRAVCRTVLSLGADYGKQKSGNGKKVLVEFSAPNIAKPFHAGHLRSTILGNFLVNAHRSLGYDVVAYNYLGDWGKQFGLLAIGFEMFGEEAKLQEDPIKYLYEIYVRINKEADADPTLHDKARAHFKAMEEGSAKELELWQRFRDLSIKELERVYETLNVKFDVYDGESKHSAGMEAAHKILSEKNLLEESEGAQLVNLEKFKLSKAMVRKSDGTTLYLTRDIAAAVARHEREQFDQMYYVVGHAQEYHFKQLFKVLELMGYAWAKQCKHVGFGLVQGMSTRKGTALFLADILKEAKDNMLEVMKSNEAKFKEVDDPEAIAAIVGTSAVVVQDLSAKRIKDYAFDWQRILRFEGETGPYLQYTHARMCGIKRKSGVDANADADFALLVEEQSMRVAQEIAAFSSAIHRAAHGLEPVTMINYLFDLAKAINSANSVLKVKDVEQPLAEARMALFESARITLNNALKLIGLTPVDKM